MIKIKIKNKKRKFWYEIKNFQDGDLFWCLRATRGHVGSLNERERQKIESLFWLVSHFYKSNYLEWQNCIKYF